MPKEEKAKKEKVEKKVVAYEPKPEEYADYTDYLELKKKKEK